MKNDINTEKLSEITKSAHQDFKNIYFLNTCDFPRTVYKYMPLDRFIVSLKSKELVFVSPETWNDPFERLYWKANYSNHNYVPEDIACMCVTKNSYINEEAAWKMYSDGNKKAVRISFDVRKLLTLLDAYAEENGCKVFLGKMDYSFDKKEIKEIGKRKSAKHDVFLPKAMDTEHYLSLMLLKRKSFNYEKEYRIFIVKKGAGLYDSKSHKILSLHCDFRNSKLIKNVVLSPKPYFDSSNTFEKRMASYYEDESEYFKKKITDYLGDCVKVDQDRLYDDIKTCVIE